MNYYTEDFVDQLDKIEIYQRYPLLKPFVGSDYGRNGPRILLIAESHYLPPESTVHRDPASWYMGREDVLTSEDQKWMRTRRILNKPLKGWTAKGHAIYRNIESALLKAGLPANDCVFRQVAFMNAFQRPAKTGDTIKQKKQDVEVAVETINEVIEATYTCSPTTSFSFLPKPSEPLASTLARALQAFTTPLAPGGTGSRTV